MNCILRVPAFEATQYLITNKEFLDFVAAGGYNTKGYWTDEGIDYNNTCLTGYVNWFIHQRSHSHTYMYGTKMILQNLKWRTCIGKTSSIH